MAASFTPPPASAGGRPAPVGDIARKRLASSAGRRLASSTGRRRALSLLSLVLVAGAVAMFGYPVYTDLVAATRQHRLSGQISGSAARHAYRTHTVKVGSGLTRMRIPALGVDVLVVEGTTPAALEAGAGHYPGTPLPGEAGNVAIAGHRTTYGRPFNRLDELRPGDKVYLGTPIGEFVYQVVPSFGGHGNPWVAGPADFSVVSAMPGHWLTLTTCHPKGSDLHRLVVRLRMVGSDPAAGQAAGPPSGAVAGAPGWV